MKPTTDWVLFAADLLFSIPLVSFLWIAAIAGFVDGGWGVFAILGGGIAAPMTALVAYALYLSWVMAHGD